MTVFCMSNPAIRHSRNKFPKSDIKSTGHFKIKKFVIFGYYSELFYLLNKTYFGNFSSLKAVGIQRY